MNSQLVSSYHLERQPETRYNNTAHLGKNQIRVRLEKLHQKFKEKKNKEQIK